MVVAPEAVVARRTSFVLAAFCAPQSLAASSSQSRPGRHFPRGAFPRVILVQPLHKVVSITHRLERNCCVRRGAASEGQRCDDRVHRWVEKVWLGVSLNGREVSDAVRRRYETAAGPPLQETAGCPRHSKRKCWGSAAQVSSHHPCPAPPAHPRRLALQVLGNRNLCSTHRLAQITHRLHTDYTPVCGAAP